MIDRRIARALQIAVLLCADATIVAILLVQAQGKEQAFGLLCAGALAGVVISTLALAAVLTRSRSLGGTAPLLAGLRLISVPVAAGVIAVWAGADAIVGPVETFAVALAVLDAIAGLAAGVAANRYTRG
ncbi:hypothetical protein [Planosporangium mesophilum]|uniref:Uncharacterized protein n=1 Tax=Planosporangium mesophilum TaxID=689768 RepID=A0A8J3TB26_9ACTN|nr:hypothetical protein [Planosporangium mesophilum]NJC85283.1 hypothetical protein [Planosporangium mesophilum]GII23263.1 hypothetical protein Pme01_28600 [Planosporangium mesophilum]